MKESEISSLRIRQMFLVNELTERNPQMEKFLRKNMKESEISSLRIRKMLFVNRLTERNPQMEKFLKSE